MKKTDAKLSAFAASLTRRTKVKMTYDSTTARIPKVKKPVTNRRVAQRVAEREYERSNGWWPLRCSILRALTAAEKRGRVGERERIRRAVAYRVAFIPVRSGASRALNDVLNDIDIPTRGKKGRAR